MTIQRSTVLSEATKQAALVWLNRCQEALWLLAVVLVPVAFLDRDYIQSEAVISYVEVPKIALLRTLAALMAVLWLVEWAIQGHLPVTSVAQVRGLRLPAGLWRSRLSGWLRAQPARWVFLAVWFFLGTTLVTTALSGSFSVSLWGEVPGQDGYPAYTVAAYVILFGVIATHLRSRPQLWRLVGAIAAMGVVVSGYAVLQHYGHDFLDLTEKTGGGQRRVTSFMGNAIFGAAVMMMTLPITLAAASLTLREPTAVPGFTWRTARPWLAASGVAILWAIVLTIQLLGITFTFSRGPWLGTIVALAAFLGLAANFVGWRLTMRAVLLLGLTALFALGFLQGMGSVSLVGASRWLGLAFVVVGVAGLTAVLVAQHLLGRAGVSLYHAALERLGVLARRPILALAALVVVLALVAALVVTRLPASLGDPGAVASERTNPATAPSGSTASEVAGRFASISVQVLNGFGGRGETWRGSWRLIRDRPWFDFDNLSLGWLRPVIGYGPDLFRYTYLLESPPLGRDLLPEEPDHAHNFFIHQTVEQGFLGLLSSLGIVAAVALAGGYQLLQRRQGYSSAHKLVLVVLLAVLAGRLLEMMVGVARVSDLTILWVLLAAFAALPKLMGPLRPAREPDAVAKTSSTRRRPRPASRAGRRSRPYNWRLFWRLAIVVWLAGAIIVLTWERNVNNVRAAVAVGNGVQQFYQGDFQASLGSLDRAIELAPDAVLYYNHRANVYLAYQINRNVPPEQGCSSQTALPYAVCLAAKSFQNNLAAAGQRPFYYRSRLALANSAYNLPQLHEETIRFYSQALALVPGSWTIRNELADAYRVAGRPEEALLPLRESLAITKDNIKSARAYFLQGLAYRDLGDLENSAQSLERSLELDSNNSPAPEARALLPQVYEGLKDFAPTGDALLRLGTAQEMNGGLAEAATSFGSAAVAFQKAGQPEMEAHVLLLQGRLYEKLGQGEDAVRAFARSLELDSSSPAAPEAYGALANLYVSQREPELAGNALFLGSLAHLKLGNLERAAVFIEQSLQQNISPTLRQTVHYARAALYEKQGDLEAGVEALQSNARRFENLGRVAAPARSYYLSAVTYGALGNLEASAQGFQRSAELYDSIGWGASAATSYFRSGAAFRDLAQWQKAADALERGLELGARIEQEIEGEQQARLALPDIYDKLGQVRKEAESRFLQGVAYRNQGELEEAVEYLNRSLELDGTSVSQRRAYGVLADVYLRLGQPQQAAESFFLLGKASQDLGQLEESAQAIERSLEIDGSTASVERAHAILVAIYSELEQPALVAAEYFRGALVYRDLGELEVSAQAFQRSAEVYAQLGHREKEARALYFLGLVYRDLGRPQEAVRALERSLELDNTLDTVQTANRVLAELYQQLGQLQRAVRLLFLQGFEDWKRGELVRAVEALERGLSLDPISESVEQAHRILAEAYQVSGRPGDAAKSLFALGATYRNRGDLERSVQAFERSLELSVSGGLHFQARLALSELYLKLGRSALAGESLYLAGLATQKLGDWEGSIPLLERSTGLYLELGQAALAARSSFQAAVAYQVVGQDESAVRNIKRSLELDSSSTLVTQYLSDLAAIYERLGQPGLSARTFYEAAKAYGARGLLDDAAPRLRKSLSLDPTGPVAPQAHRMLAEIYETLGQAEKAEEHRQAAGR